jgi:aspartyl-tRNA(Asn)/glutamyl-tRNA(Gln) amidotransferase subunit A
MSPGTADIIRAGRAVSGVAYVEAQRERWRLGETWARFFTDYDAILLPSMQLTAFGVDVPGPTEIAGTPVDPFFDDWCTLALPANLAGLPSTSVPIGLGDDGLPVAMQVMGPRWGDATTLALAAAYERLAPFPRPGEASRGNGAAGEPGRR